MLLEIFLKILNSLYFKKIADFFFEGLSQLTFMLVTFGYMSLCIVIKWCQNWDNRESISIISLFINFNSVDEPLYLTAETQQKIQFAIIIIAFICTALMLIPKPVIIYFQQQNKYEKFKHQSMEVIKMIEEDSNNDSIPHIEEPHSFGELVVH